MKIILAAILSAIAAGFVVVAVRRPPNEYPLAPSPSRMQRADFQPVSPNRLDQAGLQVPPCLGPAQSSPSLAWMPARPRGRTAYAGSTEWKRACPECIAVLPSQPSLEPGGRELRRDMKPQSPARPAFLIRRFRVSSYCPCKLCCGRWASIPMDKRTTASGESLQALMRAGERFVAADPSIPFGTLVWIDGYADGWVPVLDRGGKIRGDRLDVFFADHKTALGFGVRYVSVKIKEN